MRQDSDNAFLTRSVFVSRHLAVRACKICKIGCEGIIFECQYGRALAGDAGNCERCMAAVTSMADSISGGWEVAGRAGLPGRGDSQAAMTGLYRHPTYNPLKSTIRWCTVCSIFQRGTMHACMQVAYSAAAAAARLHFELRKPPLLKGVSLHIAEPDAHTPQTASRAAALKRTALAHGAQVTQLTTILSLLRSACVPS